MNILYDNVIFMRQKVGGISRYHYELFRGMRQMGQAAAIAGRFIKNRYLLGDKRCRRLFLPDSAGLFSLFNKKRIQKTLQNGNYDVYHITDICYCCQHLLPYIPADKKVALTIHDLIAMRHFDCIASGKCRAAERADAIIAISQATKNDIVEVLGVSPDKISVIYHGASLALPSTKYLPPPPAARYVIFVGWRSGYKNFNTFAQAMAAVMRKDDGMRLVCVGRPFSAMEKSFLRQIGIARRTLLYSNVADSRLAYLYHNAHAFVFPSQAEGFGIPILEAWACQTPVVCSDIPVFREIAADAACYFNPACEKSIAEAILSIAQDDLRAAIVSRGTERLKMFSWNNACSDTMKVYRSLAEKP
jgi:glycosyltransferase involved in cell wall biosynthesis